MYVLLSNASPWQPRKWSFEMWQQFNPKQDLIVTLIRQFYWLNITKKFFCLNFPKQWMKTKLRSKSNIKEITRIISSTRDWKVWSLVCNQKLLPLLFCWFFFYTKDFSLTDTNHYWKCLNFSLWTHKKTICVQKHTSIVLYWNKAAAVGGLRRFRKEEKTNEREEERNVKGDTKSKRREKEEIMLWNTEDKRLKEFKK